MTDYFYRLEDKLESSPVDENEEYTGEKRVVVKVRKLEVLKRSGAWVWLDDYGNGKKTKVGAAKPWACPTLDEARTAYLERKIRQLTIHNLTIKRVSKAVEMVENWDGEECEALTENGVYPGVL